jgi:hypothetical protein
MDIASSYGLTFFGVAPSRTGLRFDTVEVWGSSPHEPTIQLAIFHFCCEVSSGGSCLVGVRSSRVKRITPVSSVKKLC